MLERQRRRAAPLFPGRAEITTECVIADIQHPARGSFVSPAAFEHELGISGSPRSEGITALERGPKNLGELSSDLRRQIVQLDN